MYPVNPEHSRTIILVEGSCFKTNANQKTFYCQNTELQWEFTNLVSFFFLNSSKEKNTTFFSL